QLETSFYFFIKDIPYLVDNGLRAIRFKYTLQGLKELGINKSTKQTIFYFSLLGLFLCFGFLNCSPVHKIITESGDHLSSSPERPYFTCNQSQLGNTVAQRLSKREYENTLRDLLALVNANV